MTEIAEASVLAPFMDKLRPVLADPAEPTKVRVRLLWSAVCAAHDLAASDVIRESFMSLACDVGLINPRGWWVPSDVRETVRRHGAEDITQVIEWGLRRMNPFEDGRLR